MTTKAPAATARPDIISLDVLLSDVDEGRVQIPRFQRPYVWTPQMMRELFESVLSGYPIGSLLFWTPRSSDVRTMDKIGPIRASKPSLNQPVSLVLDGHQRLATLYGVLRLPESHPKGDAAAPEDLKWWIAYDLESKEPRQIRRPEEFHNPVLLPLRALLRTADFVRFARSIDSATNLSEESKAAYLDEADKVQRAIRDYRIALTSMRDGDVNDAVAIFSRINRSGRPMTTDQMAVALTYNNGFNLEEALDSLLGMLDAFGFGDVSRTVILQSLLYGAKKNFTRPNFDDLRKQDTQEALQDATMPIGEALTEACKFLNNTIGFRTGRLLPYALQLLLLTVFFKTFRGKVQTLEEDTRYALSRWFWATSFEGWFATASTTDVERAVRAMEAFASATHSTAARKTFDEYFVDRPLRPFPKTFDRRSARIRALLLVQIARGQLSDPVSGGRIDGSALMADPDRRDLPYVFSPNGTKPARSPANRILLPKDYGGVVRRTLASKLNAVEALESHGIDAKARVAIDANDLPGFVRAREAEMQRQEEEFLRRFGLNLGETLPRSEEEVDVEE
jgi:hypothetical protein